MGTLQNIGAFILLLGVLVFVHELGHFVVAKLLGVKVLSFSIGFGPRLLGFTRGETEYRIGALPLGGYVKMAGEDPSQEIAPEDRGRTFLEQAPWKRLAIALAGPAMNLAFPVAVYLAIGISENGQPTPAAVLGTVQPGQPAAAAGLRPGDRIVSVRAPGQPAQPVRWFEDLPDLVAPYPGQPLEFRVERDGGTLDISVTPSSEPDVNPVEQTVRGVIGVAPSWPAALVTPRPGVATPLQPLDLVTEVAGRPVRHAGELAAAVEAAACAPLDLTVRRGGEPVKLAGVPSCAPPAVGGPAWLAADPTISAVIAKVEPGSAAQAAGLTRGDIIAGIDGRQVFSYRDVNAGLRGMQAGTPIAVALADGRQVTLVPVAERYRDEGTGERKERPAVGFRLDRREGIDLRALHAAEVTVQRGAAELVQDAVAKTWYWTRITVIGLVKLVTLQLSLRNMGGIIQVYDIATEAANAGLTAFVVTMAVISVNLGLMNLLPIPVLDGGHIVTAIIEGVTRRRLSLRAREVANVIGLFLVIGLMVVALGNDLFRKFGG